MLNTFASLQGFAIARGLGNCFRPYCAFLSRCVSGACTTPSAAHRFPEPHPIFRPPHPHLYRFLCGACSVANIFLSGNRMAEIYSLPSAGGVAWMDGGWDVRGFGTHAVHLQRWPMFMMIEWEVCNSSPGHRLPGKMVDGNYQGWKLLGGRINEIWQAHGQCFYYECGWLFDFVKVTFDRT